MVGKETDLVGVQLKSKTFWFFLLVKHYAGAKYDGRRKVKPMSAEDML